MAQYQYVIYVEAEDCCIVLLRTSNIRLFHIVVQALTLRENKIHFHEVWVKR